MPIVDTEVARALVRKIEQVVAFLKYSPSTASAALVALAAGGVGYSLGRAGGARPAPLSFLDEALWAAITLYGSLGLYVVAGLLVGWIVYRVFWNLAPPPRIEGSVQATAIKGPLSFGPYDAALFRRLGREPDVATLLGHVLDDQIGLVIVSGESGAGKTSLLRAGLPAVLRAQDPLIECHYWEAVPSEAEKRLLAALQDGWKGTAPQRLMDVFGPGTGLGRRVIILDQFEQLSPGKRLHRAIFQLLKHAALGARPPQRTTLIVAFRRDYMPTWTEFEHDELAGRRQVIVPVRLFVPAQAKEVMAVIAEEAAIGMDDVLATELIGSMRNEDGRVSPADIGITMLALNERAQGKAGRHLDKGDYRIKGGATGLLAEYVSGQIERYPSGVRSKILLALLQLADLGNDRRRAEGRRAEELAETAGLPVGALEGALRDLASPRVRVLEELPGGAYRLPHERLIPALRQLSGLVLARAEQAARGFERAYADWAGGQRRRGLLLRGSALTNVVRYREQLNWSVDQEGKEAYFRESLRRRRLLLAARGVGMVLLCGGGYLGWGQVESSLFKRDLAAWKLPDALYEQQDRLDRLDISNMAMTNLSWMRHCIKAVTLRAPSLDGLSGLPQCGSPASLKLLGITSGSMDALKKLEAPGA